MLNIRTIYYSLSPNLRLTVRKIVYFPIDLYENIFHKRQKYVPKKGDIFIGMGDFLNQGKQHLTLLKNYANLKPSDTVLDVGSGIGRSAVALTNFLNKEAKYEGFDIVFKGVDWCTKNLKPDFPNFNFTHVPLNNDLYSLTDKSANDFKFPYQNDTFDVVFLFSVFTHMQEAEVTNYLSEIERVLKPNGTCLSTFFTYDLADETHISDSNSNFNFPFKFKNYRLMNEKVPSANIAFSNDFINSVATKSNLKIVNKVLGYWNTNRKNDTLNDYQDIILFKKQL